MQGFHRLEAGLGGIQHGPAHAVGHVLRRGKRAVVTRVDIYDGRDGPLAAACQLAFTIVRPRTMPPA